VTPHQQAQALIALAEQTYLENYYGHDLHLFNRNETPPGIDADEQHCGTDEGQSL
jgi:hypothetical protein